MMKISNIFRIRKKEPHKRMPRTVEGTIFEVVALFMVIAMWGLAVYMFHHAPETIPTHFDIHGNPNSYGSRVSLLYLAGGGTFAAVILLVCAYFPTTFMRVPPSKVTIRQCVVISRGVRITSLLFCLFFSSLIFMVCYPNAWQPKAFFWTFFASFVSMAVALAVMEFLIKRKA